MTPPSLGSAAAGVHDSSLLHIQLEERKVWWITLEKDNIDFRLIYRKIPLLLLELLQRILQLLSAIPRCAFKGFWKEG